MDSWQLVLWCGGKIFETGEKTATALGESVTPSRFDIIRATYLSSGGEFDRDVSFFLSHRGYLCREKDQMCCGDEPTRPKRILYNELLGTRGFSLALSLERKGAWRWRHLRGKRERDLAVMFNLRIKWCYKHGNQLETALDLFMDDEESRGLPRVSVLLIVWTNEFKETFTYLPKEGY